MNMLQQYNSNGLFILPKMINALEVIVKQQTDPVCPTSCTVFICPESMDIFQTQPGTFHDEPESIYAKIISPVISVLRSKIFFLQDKQAIGKIGKSPGSPVMFIGNVGAISEGQM